MQNWHLSQKELQHSKAVSQGKVRKKGRELERERERYREQEREGASKRMERQKAKEEGSTTLPNVSLALTKGTSFNSQMCALCSETETLPILSGERQKGGEARAARS